MKNNKGFSLVELIVVIAIMAILATVAVIGVSVYIPKAQKANDAELVNDIIYAVTLRDYETQFASNGNGVVGYVIVTKDGDAFATEGDIHEAMVAAFGANYAEELHLSYDGWTDADKLLDVALTVKEQGNLGAINNSTFLTQSSTEELLGAVQDCTSLFGKLFDNEGDDKQGILGGVAYNYMPELHNAIVNAGYTGDDINGAVVSNAVVLVIAEKVSSDEQRDNIISGFADASLLREQLRENDSTDVSGETTKRSQLDEIATKYAATKALVEYLGGDYVTTFNQMFDGVENWEADVNAGPEIIRIINEGSNEISEQLFNAGQMDSNGNPIPGSKLYEYYATSQAQRDGEAYVGMMSAVNELSDEYMNDSAAMNNSQLFTDSNVTNRVNSFVSLAMLGEAELESIQNAVDAAESAVVLLFVTKDGVVTCTPCPAEVIG